MLQFGQFGICFNLDIAGGGPLNNVQIEAFFSLDGFPRYGIYSFLGAFMEEDLSTLLLLLV